MIVTALLITGAPRLLVLTLDVPLWTVLVIWGVNGFGSGFLNPVLSVVVLERLPRHVVGRGMSMLGAIPTRAPRSGPPCWVPWWGCWGPLRYWRPLPRSTFWLHRSRRTTASGPVSGGPPARTAVAPPVRTRAPGTTKTRPGHR